MLKTINKYKPFILAKYKKANKLRLSANEKRKVFTKKTLFFIQKKPFTSFFSVLLIFLLLMIAGNVLFSPKPEKEKNLNTVKAVETYKLGGAPRINVLGKVEKSGVIKIVSQMPGIVSNINVYEGQAILNGTNILSLSSNYQGGNALSVARQIASTQYSTAKENFDLQKDVIIKQRVVANKNKENGNLLKDITAQSAISTKELFTLNNSIVDTMEANIKYLESTNIGGVNDSAILQSKQLISQFQSAMAQTNASFRNLEVSVNENSDDISNLNFEVALKQLEIQEKSLNMSLELSRLSYNAALINEANMYPSSPVSGTVNKIFVHLGDSINPGTPLANISANNQHVKIVAYVPENVAKNISNFEPSTILIGKKTIEMIPTFVSKDATSGVLYSVVYDLDDSFASALTDSTYVNISIPIGVADTTNISPFIPLDSVIQTQEEAYVFVVDKGKAKSIKINLGQIQGKYVEVISGLPKDSEIIMDRNVIEGDKIKANN